jgi:hypothetical protein
MSALWLIPALVVGFYLGFATCAMLVVTRGDEVER